MTVNRERAWRRHAAAAILAMVALLSAEVVQADLGIRTLVDGLAAARCCREQCHRGAATHCGGDCCTIGAPQPSASAVLGKKPFPATNPLQAVASVAGAESPRHPAACLAAEADPPPGSIPIYILRCVLRI